MIFLHLDFTPITPMEIGRWYAQVCSIANRQLVVEAQGNWVDEFYIAAFNQYIFMGWQRLNQMGVKRKARGDDKLQLDKYQCMDAKSPVVPLAVAQRGDNWGEMMHFQTLPHIGVDQGRAKAKLEEAIEGALSDPTEPEETGNPNVKTQTRNFIIRILNCLADAVEAKEATTKAKMEVKPEDKARGDTIEEGLEEAIDTAGSSKSINQLEQRAKGSGTCLLTASSGRPVKGSCNVKE
uniref:Uncharacterized protein n=1 Tax=Romanomermis culicivorax TaxID=13658 RepID=A0A915JDA1_ROMCU